jgi:toxin ParE1/3/4
MAKLKRTGISMHSFNGLSTWHGSPSLYQAVDDIRPGYRRSVCGVDSIYYRAVDDIVEIMRILGQQDVGESL